MSSDSPAYDTSSLEELLTSLPKVLAQREKALEEREKELQRLEVRLQTEHPNLGKPSDVLRLNVGGNRVDVLRRTLCQIENTMLASKFSGRWDDSLEKDIDGCFFIDQQIELFLPMINYLRDKANHNPLSAPVASPNKGENFKRMVEYYGMTLGIYPVEVCMLEDSTAEEYVPKVIASHPEYKIKLDEWGTCVLQTCPGNNRVPESFEVTLGAYTSAQIGWINASDKMAFLTSSKGAGYGTSSIAIDCGRSGIVSDGVFTAIDGLSLGEGSTIRSEDYGKRWYVNDTLVASTGAQSGVVTLGAEQLEIIHMAEQLQRMPCFSFKGECTVSTIELFLPLNLY